MNYMLSCRQSLAAMRKADEIRVLYQDRGRLRDMLADPMELEWDQDIVIYLPANTVIDWSEINVYRDVFKLVFSVEDTHDIQMVKNQGYYEVFWSYPVSTFYELRGLIDLGVTQVLLDAPLYFDLPTVKEICGDVEIRLIANKCFNNYMERKDGILGTYIRPEDVDAYSEYVDHIEFAATDLRQERTLLHIYRDEYWPGNLNLLLTNLNYNVDNRGFPADFAERRIKCAHRCQRTGLCHYCITQFKYINTIQENIDWIKEQLEILDQVDTDEEVN